MAAVSFDPPAVVPVQRAGVVNGSAAKASEDRGTHSFADVLGDDGGSAETSAVSADPKDEAASGDKPVADESPDAKGLLDWLQSLLGAGDANAKAALPGDTPPTQAPPPPLPSDAILKPAVGETPPTQAPRPPPLTVTDIFTKTIPHPGDTPPTRVPLPLPTTALVSGEESDDATNGFSLSRLTKAAADDSSVLSPTLNAALTAAVTAALAVPDPVSRAADSAPPSLLQTGAVTALTPQAAPVFAAVPQPPQNLLTTPLLLDPADLPARLGERVQWLVDGGVQEARLQLHPRDLGTVDVHVRVEARGASVWFAAEHPAARAALELALPQLRERFAADGVALAQTQVAPQAAGWSYSGSQQQQARAQRPFKPSNIDGGNDAELPSVAGPRAIVHLGLIDRYA